MKVRNFTVTVDDKEVNVTVRTPSIQDNKEASKIYNNAFTDALKSKAVVRARLDDLLVDQGLWDDSKQQKFDTLQRQILDGEKQLAKGGISLREAKNIALEMKKHRSDLRELIAVKTNLDTHTAEGQADNARFNYLVFACTIYTDNQQRVFTTYEDYLNKASEPLAIKAAQNVANMIYGLDNDYENNLPENKFLKSYKFVDDKLRLIDKQGRLIDEDGRLIDENNRYINEQGEYVDKYGNLLTEQGDYKVEFSPFLDDEGQPIVVENSSKTEEVVSTSEEN
jgi:hypothetical protein